MMQTATESNQSSLFLNPLTRVFTASFHLFCISIPTPNAKMSPPYIIISFSLTLLYILYIVYFNADAVYICIHFMPVFSSLYTIHIYVAFTIFYWHYSHHTIIQYSLVSPFPLHSHPTLPHPTLLVKLHLKQLIFKKKQFIYLFWRNLWHQEKVERRKCVGKGGSINMLKRSMITMATTKRNVCRIMTKQEKCTTMTMIIIACEKYWPIKNNGNIRLFLVFPGKNVIREEP